MSEQEARARVGYEELVRPEWFSREDSVLWTAGYRVLRAPLAAFPSGPYLFDFGDVRAVVSWGTLRYLDTAATKVWLTDAHEWHFDAKDVVEKSTPEGRHIVFLTALPNESTEPQARAAVAAARGLLTVLNGRNMAWDCVYENVVRRTQRSGYSPTWESPLAFPVPDLTPHGVDRVFRSAAAYGASPAAARARLALSLRWLEAAARDSDVDAVLKYWVALETLAMPDDTNIRPINEALKRVYQKPMGEVQATFGVGRIFGLRGRIVHHGAIVPIDQKLLHYLEALYADVLLDYLGQPPERRGLAVLGTPGFNLRALLHE